MVVEPQVVPQAGRFGHQLQSAAVAPEGRGGKEVVVGQGEGVCVSDTDESLFASSELYFFIPKLVQKGGHLEQCFSNRGNLYPTRGTGLIAGGTQ